MTAWTDWAAATAAEIHDTPDEAVPGKLARLEGLVTEGPPAGMLPYQAAMVALQRNALVLAWRMRQRGAPLDVISGVLDATVGRLDALG